MSIAFEQHSGPWTVDDVLALPEDSRTRIELVGGALVMSPSPGVPHQRASRRLAAYLDAAADAAGGLEVLEAVNLIVPDGLVIPDIVVVDAEAAAQASLTLDPLSGVSLGAHEPALERQWWCRPRSGKFLLRWRRHRGDKRRIGRSPCAVPGIDVVALSLLAVRWPGFEAGCVRKVLTAKVQHRSARRQVRDESTRLVGWNMIEVIDADAARLALSAGALSCPSCSTGRLGPWGTARRRVVLAGAGRRLELRPDRARCRDCRATHVLLPADVLAGRAYGTGVIGAALTAAAHGHGRRRIAAELGVPTSTVAG